MLKDLRKRTNGRRFPRARLFWVRPGRCSEWWDNSITQRVTAEEWKENFRMNHETFLKLCDDLRPSLEGQATRTRMPSSVEKQVAVTLYYLADEGPNASVQPLAPTCFNSGLGLGVLGLVSILERLVTILGRFCSYYAEVFFMSTRKAVRYSVDKALGLEMVFSFLSLV